MVLPEAVSMLLPGRIIRPGRYSEDAKMVTKVAKNGLTWEEPPYTEEEEAELYRRMTSGPITVLYGSRGGKPPKKSPPPPPEE
jgi:hypothetical protein